jgi:hypothetical protein
MEDFHALQPTVRRKNAQKMSFVTKKVAPGHLVIQIQTQAVWL